MFYIGSFTCTCNSGYFGSGFSCSDVDECSSDPCDENATCDNIPGGHVCTCNLGFAGNGDSCADIDECEQDPCDSNASCSNIEGIFIFFRYFSSTFFIKYSCDLIIAYF